MKRSYFLRFGLLMLFTALITPFANGVPPTGHRRLLDFSGGPQQGAEPLRSNGAAQQQTVVVHFEAIDGEAKEIEIALFDGVILTVVRRESEGFVRRDADTFTWSGKVLSNEDWGGDVVLTVHKNAMVGSIYTPSDVYSILPQSGGTHVLLKADQSLLPPCGKVLANDARFFRSSGIRQEPQEHLAQALQGIEIEVLVVYTDDVRVSLGGPENATAFAINAVETVNTAYQNSGIKPRLHLAHAMEINYDETSNAETDLTFIRADPTVATARDIYHADVVAFVIEDALDAAGIAYLMTAENYGAAFESFAYSVSVRRYAIGMLTFAHEIGHNQGAEHNPENVTEDSEHHTVFPYSFGHYEPAGPDPFRTVMSYAVKSVCDACPRIPHFSNPVVGYRGQPTGIYNQRDNARTINNTALLVSRFRNAPLTIIDLRSRKFSADLDLGNRGVVESRGGPNHQILVTFPGPVTLSGAVVSSCDSQATATQHVDGGVVTVNLSSVADAQELEVTLLNVAAGSEAGNVSFTFKVLHGDANGDEVVNSGDTLLIRKYSGSICEPSGGWAEERIGRFDLNGDCTINAADAALVRFLSGRWIPEAGVCGQ